MVVFFYKKDKHSPTFAVKNGEMPPKEGDDL